MLQASLARFAIGSALLVFAFVAFRRAHRGHHPASLDALQLVYSDAVEDAATWVALDRRTPGRTLGQRPITCDRLTEPTYRVRCGAVGGIAPSALARRIDRPGDGLPVWPGGDLQPPASRGCGTSSRRLGERGQRRPLADGRLGRFAGARAASREAPARRRGCRTNPLVCPAGLRHFGHASELPRV